MALSDEDNLFSRLMNYRFAGNDEKDTDLCLLSCFDGLVGRDGHRV